MFEKNRFNHNPSPVHKAQLEVALLLEIAKGDPLALNLESIMGTCIQYLYLQNMSEQVLLGTLEECQRNIVTEGDVCRINEIARVIASPDQRLETMDFALRITFSGQEMQREVYAVLKMLQTAFELSHKQVEKLVLRYL